VRIVVISDLNSAYGATSYEPEINKAIERASKKTLYGELNHPSDPSINLERAAILTEHLD